MVRKLRIEYRGAFYHVMNRGRGHGSIFNGPEYYTVFMKKLSEAYHNFDACIHCYCLMHNHYHLLLETPQGNLSRIMRHINGVYTQRYNRLMKTDGPLFRGRFKAILIDSDEYFLQLTRYIHRNPVATSPPLVTDIKDYHWSSLPAYLGSTSPPDWLIVSKTFQMLKNNVQHQNYAHYMNEANDDITHDLINKYTQSPILGGQRFHEYLFDTVLADHSPEIKAKIIQRSWTLPQIIQAVATVCDESTSFLFMVKKGPNTKASARHLAIYLCRSLGKYSLRDTADYFHLSNPCTISRICQKVVKESLHNRNFKNKIDRVISYMVKNAT